MLKKFLIGLAIVLIASLFIFSLGKAQNRPAVPTGLQVNATSSCAFEVSWNQSSDADSYDVTRYYGDQGVEMINIFSYTNRITKDGKIGFIDTDGDNLWQSEDKNNRIDPNETYSYSIQAVNKSNGTQSEWSSQASATTWPLPSKPDAPTNIMATSSNGTIELSWKVTGQLSNLFKDYGQFEIWRASSSDGGYSYSDFNKINSIPSNQNVNGRYFYIDNQNINPTESYKFKLRTKEVGGLGCDPTYSNHIVLSDDSVITIPSIPSNLSAQFDNQQQKVILTWNDNSHGGGNETKFEIQRSTDPNFQSSVMTTTTPPNITSYVDTNIVPTVTYLYRIRSCIEDNLGIYCSPFTSPVSVTVLVPAPTNFRATLSKFTSPYEITLTWEWPMDRILSGQQFEIKRSDQPNQSVILDYQDSLNNSTNQPNDHIYKDNVSEKKMYTYSIRTSSSAGYSEWVEAQINTNITQIVGWAWMGNGLGWIRLSNDSVDSSWGPANQARDFPSYGVYIDNQGKLAGYAWSPYAGWLSFNDEGNGQPSINPEPGTRVFKLTGWAKFVSSTQGQGLGEWVSLSTQQNENVNYGLYYSTTTDANGNVIGEFRGFVWGGNSGWITFGGPILKNVISQPNASFNVVWENPIDYSRIEIWVVEDTNNNGRFDQSETFNQIPSANINSGSTRSLTARGQQSANVTVPNVKVNTLYGFKVRGYLP